MTALMIVRRAMPLDNLVVRVYHLELKECRNEAEFRDAIRLVLRNVDEVMDALCGYQPAERRIGRAADRVKMKAVSMRKLCAAIPESFDDPEGWRQVAVHIIANYEQFRIEAGLLYQLAVPGSSFGVLRAAL
ncbi:MAG TPA: hypothetical protein VFF39_10730 [Verrucomicrobiae bacterium]|nr:hypothetical protein [Verrucomicrobiae bacterium]